MHIKIQPQDEEEATLMLASNVRHLATADVPAPKVSWLQSENMWARLDGTHCRLLTTPLQLCANLQYGAHACVPVISG